MEYKLIRWKSESFPKQEIEITNNFLEKILFTKNIYVNMKGSDFSNVLTKCDGNFNLSIYHFIFGELVL